MPIRRRKREQTAEILCGTWPTIMRIALLLLTGQPLSNTCTPYVLVYVVATNHRFHYQNANVHVSFPNAHALAIKWVWSWRARSRKMTVNSRKLYSTKISTYTVVRAIRNSFCHTGVLGQMEDPSSHPRLSTISHISGASPTGSHPPITLKVTAKLKPP